MLGILCNGSQGLLWAIWCHLGHPGPSGAIWGHRKPSEAIWDHLGPSGPKELQEPEIKLLIGVLLIKATLRR